MAKQQGSRCAARAPVERRIEVQTICFSLEAAPSRGGGDGGHRFSVHLTCHATRSFEFRRCAGQRCRGRDVLEQTYTGYGTWAEFPVADPAEVQSEESCRGAIRRMFMELPQLRMLYLTEDEWDVVVPADVVPEIVALARGSGGGDGCTTFCFAVSVHQRVIHSEEALVMACKERTAEAAAGETTAECAICFDGLGTVAALELPGCAHAFHRRCISRWFSKAATCPMCRGDVRLNTLREFLDLSNGEPTRQVSNL